MTTYSYSVKHWEAEARFASALEFPEWLATAKALGTYVEEVHFDATDVTPEWHLHGGPIAAVPEGTARKVYRACRTAGPRLKVKARTQVQQFAAFLRAYSPKQYVTGLQAVYAAYATLRDAAAHCPSGFPERVCKWAANVAAATVHGACDAANFHEPTAAVKMGLVATALPIAVQTSAQTLLGVRLLKSVRHARSLGAFVDVDPAAVTPEAAAVAARRVQAKARAMMPFWLRSALPIANHVILRTQWGVTLLGTSELVRLEQLAASVMNIEATAALSKLHVLASPTALLSILDAELKRLCEAGAAIPEPDTVHVCRTYRQAYSVGLAAKAGNLAGLAAQWGELRAMPHAESSGAVQHALVLARLTIDDLLGVGKLYKVCPMQSSQASATLYARKLKSESPNPYVPIAADRPPFDPATFEKCLRDEYAVALRNARAPGATRLRAGVPEPAWFAAWVERGAQPDIVGWSAVLDLRGAAAAITRSDASAATFKDSALCPDTVPADASETAPREETNMLLRRVMDPAYPTQEAAFNALLRAEPRVQKGDQKPENFKAPLRLFYEAQLLDRLGMSQIEENVDRVAQHHPCFMIGKGPRTIEARARELVEPVGGGEAKRLFSYDLSNWSPGMRALCQEASGRVLAEIFDDPRMGRSYACQKGATVFVQKNGELCGYVNAEANFEGQDGKAMTMLHLGLMSATIARLRQVTGSPDVRADLMAYIDDGLAAIVGPTRRIDHLFEEFMRCTEEVYGFYGYKLAAMKCFPSDRLAVFLSEVYYAGTHVTSYTKAALRVAAEPKEAHESLPDRIAKLTAGAQGAVAAGTPAVPAAIFGAFLAAWEIAEWTGTAGSTMTDSWTAALSMPAQLVAYMLVCPVAYGGFGMKHIGVIAKTASGRAFAEGIVVMQSFARMYPELRPLVVKQLRTPLPRRSPAAQLRNPLGVSGVSQFRTSRIEQALATVLPTVARNPFVRAMFAANAAFDLDAYAAAVLATTETVNVQAVRMLWAATPAAPAEAFVRKFETGRSMARVLGAATMARIARENRDDARRAFIAFR